MKKYILVSVICLASLGSIQAQSFGIKSIGLETYQNTSFNTVNKSSELSVAAHQSDSPKYGYSYGINAKILELKRFSFSSTLSYTNMGFHQPHGGYGDYIDPEQGYAYTQPKPGEPASGSFEWRYNYIDLGIGGNYNVLNKKTKLYLHFQPEINYLVNFKHINTQYDINGTLLKKDSDDRTKYYEIRRLGASINLGFGSEFNIGKRINIFTHLNYKRTLITPHPEFVTKDILHSIGLKLGVRFKL